MLGLLVTALLTASRWLLGQGQGCVCTSPQHEQTGSANTLGSRGQPLLTGDCPPRVGTNLLFARTRGAEELRSWGPGGMVYPGVSSPWVCVELECSGV